MILGHNVEYTGSMSRLPILVLECSKGGPNRTEKWLFEGEKVDEIG